MERHATSIICEDIRTEDSGKLILSGVYTGQIVVPEFPANIGKLNFIVKLRSSIKDRHTKFQIRVDLGQSGSIEGPVMTVAAGSVPENVDNLVYFETQAIVSSENITFSEPGTISVYARDESQEYLAGKIRVEHLVDRAINMSPIVITAAFYDLVSRENNEKNPKFALSLMNFIANSMPNDFKTGISPLEPLVIQTSQTQFVIVSNKLIRDISKVSILNIEGSPSYKLTQRDDFVAVADFDGPLQISPSLKVIIED